MRLVSFRVSRDFRRSDLVEAQSLLPRRFRCGHGIDRSRKPPQFAVPEPQSSGAPKVLLNPKALTPTNSTRYDGTGYVNSGLLFPPGNPGKLPSSFSLTFTKPGRFEYSCLVHADAGQRGIIVVQ